MYVLLIKGTLSGHLLWITKVSGMEVRRFNHGPLALQRIRLFYLKSSLIQKGLMTKVQDKSFSDGSFVVFNARNNILKNSCCIFMKAKKAQELLDNKPHLAQCSSSALSPLGAILSLQSWDLNCSQ